MMHTTGLCPGGIPCRIPSDPMVTSKICSSLATSTITTSAAAHSAALVAMLVAKVFPELTWKAFLKALDARVAEMLDAAVALGVRGPAVGAVEEQGRAGDRRPQRLDLALRDVGERPDVEVVVELPAPGAVLVAVDAVDGEVPRLLVHRPGA